MAARIEATGPVTVYVRGDGSDSNNGLTNTSAGAFRTYQAAIDHLLNNYDLRGNPATVQAGTNGAYDPFKLWQPLVGAGTKRPLSVIGNPSNPSDVTITAATGAAIENWRSTLYVAGIKLESPHGNGLFGNELGRTEFEAMDFGDCCNSQILAGAAHMIAVNGAYKISGDAQVHWHLTDNALLFCQQQITLLNTPNFSAEFLGMNKASARLAGTTFTGSATGKRHLVYHQSMVDSGGQSPATFLPGNIAGTVEDGNGGAANTGGLWL